MMSQWLSFITNAGRVFFNRYFLPTRWIRDGIAYEYLLSRDVLEI